MEKSETNFFGLTNFRNERKKFGIKTDDRRRHFYCIGKTGMGKSNMMENMAIQDIQEGRGMAYVDPHGEGAEKLLDFIPAKRINDVVFFNPADLDYPIAFNVMERVDFRYRHLIAGGLMGVFKKVWPDVWSARMEYILNNAILALLEYPDATLLGINRMLADPEYREKVVSKIKDPIVKAFWVTEYARYNQRYETEATAAIQNKVGQFISNPLIRNLIGQVKSTIDMRDIMDKEKIFIMDLSKGRIGEDNSRLMGALLITRLQLAAMSRVDIPEEHRKDFYLYVDEFQNFATESFANILSEARKYRLNITLGHQYITQMEEEVRDAVFGNVGTLAVFRIGAEDAEFLEREFTPEFTAEDLVNLPKYNIYLKLMIDGIAGHPFSAETLPPPLPLEDSNRSKIIKASRERYGVKREIVEEKISRWSGFVDGKDVREEGGHPIINKSNQGKSFQRSGVSASNAPQMDGQTTLYDAVCSSCGKPTKVIFPPEKGRAVYCKSCLKKLKSDKSIASDQIRGAHDLISPNQSPQGKESLPEAVGKSDVVRNQDDKDVKIQDIPFHNPKKVGKEDRRDLDPKKSRTNLTQHVRKEINLSELRKALEESLEDSKDKKQKLSGGTQEELEKQPQKKNPEEELKDRIEEEKAEDSSPTNFGYEDAKETQNKKPPKLAGDKAQEILEGGQEEREKEDKKRKA
ncbi:MAG: CxxC-x17-CxxC domain-containing protein [bacterium]